MRVMAVDYGDARTGIAVSDVSRSLAGDAFVVHCKNMSETARRVAEEARGREVSCIVVGYPKNMDGSLGARAERSERFARLVREHLGGSGEADGASGAVGSSGTSSAGAGSSGAVEVKLWDERLTTVSAHRILTETGKRGVKHGAKRKNTVDAVAACLILESYLASL